MPVATSRRKHPRNWPITKRYGFVISSRVKKYAFQPIVLRFDKVLQFRFPKYLSEDELDEQIETRGALLTALTKIRLLEDELIKLKEKINHE